MKLNYGGITGHQTYLLGKCKSTPQSRINYAYLAEKTILKATQTGLATCWIGYFDPSYFDEMTVEKEWEIPSIVILGYSHEKPSLPDRFARFAVKASKRQDWEKLFSTYPSGLPLTPDQAGLYSVSLEMVRLAPSAGNTQPWRIFYDEKRNEFHFFKKPVSQSYQERGLHDIDMGIALAHFELASGSADLSGSWIRHSPEEMNSKQEMQYMISWRML